MIMKPFLQSRFIRRSIRTELLFIEIVAILVQDLVESSVVPHGPEADTATRPLIQHSDAITVQSQELLAFLRDRFYQSKRILGDMEVGRTKIRRQFAHLIDNPEEIPDTMQRRGRGCTLRRLVCDYLAGMTDRFLMSQ